MLFSVFTTSESKALTAAIERFRLIMAKSRRQQVRERARDRCEYCQLPQACTMLPHELDHIRSKKHHGPTTVQNLCWACAGCNSSKGSNIPGYAHATVHLVSLFNPRQEHLNEHFA